MKILSFPIGDDLLEADNNMWTGVETITFNGVVVSKAFNWFRGVHEFGVATADGQGTDFYRVIVAMQCTGAVVADVYRNEECLLANTKEARQELEHSRRGLYRTETRQPPRSRRVATPLARRAERSWREEDLV